MNLLTMGIKNSFLLPAWVKKHNIQYQSIEEVPDDIIERIKKGLVKFNAAQPEVTVAIPAYNEEKDILKMLSSFADMTAKYPTELFIINNNSTDSTQRILNKLGVQSILETKQGISFARQAGLDRARGKYFLNADADSIYPEGWIDTYVERLKNPEVACVYGKYSFIPSGDTPRFVLGFYEMVTRVLFNLRRKKMDFFNVLGFNFAFRTEDGRKVGGFNTTRKRWSDGWMAMTLLELGRIERVTDERANVWTSDRRLVYDGGLIRAVSKRLRKEIGRYAPFLSAENQ